MPAAIVVEVPPGPGAADEAGGGIVLGPELLLVAAGACTTGFWAAASVDRGSACVAVKQQQEPQ